MEESNGSQEERALQPLEEKSSLAPTNIHQIQISRQQEEVFDTALKDDQLWSRFLLIASAFGILLILGSLAEVATGNITLAIAQAIVGTAIDAITILIQNPRREAKERIDSIYNKIIEAERFSAAIELAATLEGDARNRVTEAIITKLINSEDKGQEAPKQLQAHQQNNLITKVSNKRELGIRGTKHKKSPKQQSNTEQEEDIPTNENHDENSQ